MKSCARRLSRSTVFFARWAVAVTLWWWHAENYMVVLASTKWRSVHPNANTPTDASNELLNVDRHLYKWLYAMSFVQSLTGVIIHTINNQHIFNLANQQHQHNSVNEFHWYAHIGLFSTHKYRPMRFFLWYTVYNAHQVQPFIIAIDCVIYIQYIGLHIVLKF